MTPVRVKNDAGWQGEIEAAWLKPVIKSPREIKTLRVRLEDLRYLVFMPPADVREAIERGRTPPLNRYPKAAEYIHWGEKQGYPNRPTCAGRMFWWDVGEQKQQDIIILRFRDQRNWTPIVGVTAAIGDIVFVGRYRDRSNASAFNALLNCTIPILTSEVLGRINLGEGLLTTYGPDIDDFLTIDPTCLTDAQLRQLLSAFNRLATRPIRSIFEELGFELCRQRKCEHPEHPYEFVQPEKLTLEQVQRASPDRFELDSVVFDVLGLTDEECLAVYRAVAELVKTRLVKAKKV